jgi:hypothetical protein
VNIGADFKKLQADCRIDRPFVGDIELGRMARERGAAKRNNVGLAELTATLLWRNLKKDPTVSVSTHWADAELGHDFITTAKLNVYATWAVYDTLDHIDVPHPITSDSPAGMAITLHANDGQPVAHGIIAFDRPPKFEGVNVTANRAIIIVSEVSVPGYLIPASLRADKTPTALSSLGRPPFSILCTTRSLCTRSAVSVAREWYIP